MRIVITRCLPTKPKLHVVYVQPIRKKFLPKCFSALRVITVIIVVKQNIMYVTIFCQILINIPMYTYPSMHVTTNI